MKIKIALMAVCLVPVLCARASWYDITFTQTGETDNYGSATPPSVTDAVGQIDVVHGFAVGGSLDVLTGPDAGMYKLVAGSGGDGVFVYDNVVYPNLHNGGFLDGTAGLLWSVSGTAGNSAEMNMWYNATANYGAPAGAYSLYGAPPNYNPEAYGAATITAVVPEVSTVISGALLALPFGASALRILRRNKSG